MASVLCLAVGRLFVIAIVIAGLIGYVLCDLNEDDAVWCFAKTCSAIA